MRHVQYIFSYKEISTILFYPVDPFISELMIHLMKTRAKVGPR